MIKYSIIIPHHNNTDTLQQLLDSIPQNGSFQIIIVDDCSDKIDFTSFPGIERKDVQLIRMESCQGAGTARNIGLEYANGKWVLFADADDYFMPELETRLDTAATLNKDIVIFNIDTTDNNSLQGKKYHQYISSYKNEDATKRDVLYRTWTPWAKLYNHNFIKKNKLYFQPRKKGNDCFFALTANAMAKEIEIIDIPLYHLRYSPKSLSHTNMMNWDYMFDVYDLWLWRYYFYKTHNIPLWKEYNILYPFKEIKKKFGIRKAFFFLFLGLKYKYNFLEFIKIRLLE